MGKKIKSETMNIRLSIDEKKKIEYCAKRLGLTRTEVLMNGVEIITGMIMKHEKNKCLKQ